MTQCHLSHFDEKTSFCQSLDKRVYVTMSPDKKGLCHKSILSFFRHVDLSVGSIAEARIFK